MVRIPMASNVIAILPNRILLSLKKSK